MATIDWPAGLIPQAAELSLRKSGAQFASPFNGTLQAVDFIAERWVLSCSLAPQFQHDPSGVGVFANRLAGGVERVRVWPFHTGGAPRGTLRGNVTVRTAAARGDSVLRVQGALAAPNLIGNGGMEVDSDADGRADNWTPYTNGSTGSVVFSVVPGNQSQNAQRVDASALGGSVSDLAGVLSSATVSVAVGSLYTLSADTRDTGATIALSIGWSDVADNFISAAEAFFPTGGPSAWTRRSVTGSAPPGATKARVYVWMQARLGGGGSAGLEIDNLQFQAGTVATPFIGSPTLRAGDFLGAGGQLFQVATDFTLLDSGAGDIPVINRARGTIAAGSPVTWYRPTCEMVLPAMQAGPVRRPGVIEGVALDLVEVW
jgi:hypothetical protein